jgi:hypothetical protein
VSALISTGMEISEAAAIAARANRLAGHYAKPTAATQVIEIVSHIPQALEDILCEKKRGEGWQKTPQRRSATSPLK